MRVDVGLEKIRDYLEKNKAEHIQRIQRLVQQPSVSTEDLGVWECAELLVEYHRNLGCQEANIVRTKGFPGVWASYNVGAPKTIIVYGNFDTRPVLPNEKWEHEPYSASLVSSPPYEKVLVGRGVSSFKGPYVAWLNALEALLATEGSLPVNVITLLEGDEILGSPNFRDMYEKYKDQLATANACFSPGASQDSFGQANMTLGYKGMIYADLVASGIKWGRGPQGSPLHGMAKSVVDSPVWRLVHALGTLTKPDGNTISVNGFYDDLQPPTESERRDALANGRWNQVLPGVSSVNVPAGDLSDEETILNYYYGPSLNINGLRSGFTGPHTLPFSLPDEASARFDIRLPRGYKVQRVIEMIRDHLDAAGYQDLELRVMGAFDPSNTDPGSDLVLAIRRAFDQMDVPLMTTPCSGGGGPWSMYATELGLPVIRNIGIGSGGSNGGADEYMVIDGTDRVGGLVECELSHIQMLKSYAEGV